ncbi:hypothetical protein [Solirubrobacter phytolaccae]
MKARDKETTSALRTALAAIDNAEAVVAPDHVEAPSSEHVAGARAGVGSTEAERRALSLDDVHTLLQAQIDERAQEADRYDALGQADAAVRLRREADALRGYVPR